MYDVYNKDKMLLTDACTYCTFHHLNWVISIANKYHHSLNSGQQLENIDLIAALDRYIKQKITNPQYLPKLLH